LCGKHAILFSIMESIIKVIVPAFMTFLVGIALTPFFTPIFLKHKLWKKVSRKSDTNTDAISEDFKKIHNEEEEVSTPRVGGIIIWFSVCVVTGLLWVIAHSSLGGSLPQKFEFVSRNQTFLPLAALMLGSLMGLLEDFFEIFKGKNTRLLEGLPAKYLVSIIALFGIVFGVWFYIKLDINGVYIPFYGYYVLGIWFIPFYVVVTLGTFSSRVIDGIDGLAGGVMATAFASYALIAFTRGQYDLAAFSSMVMGGIMAFLWFNIPPARFYMGETGMLGLTLCLVVIAFLVNAPLLLLVVGFPLAFTAFSSAVQIASKKYLKKKVFRIAPFHNHLLAIGWSRPRIVMRYWIISVMCAILGVVISLLG
jgi:phospho-N-acetylmuramoyl-pentapeptide-transferase